MIIITRSMLARSIYLIGLHMYMFFRALFDYFDRIIENENVFN